MIYLICIEFSGQDVGLAFYSSDIIPSNFLYKRKMLLILDNCDELYNRAIHTFHSLLNMFLNECKISLIITTSVQIQVPEVYNIKRFALRNLNNLESLVMLSLNSPLFASQLLEAEIEQNDYENTMNEIVKECKGLPKKIIKWAKKLEKYPPGKIFQMMTYRRIEEDGYLEDENIEEVSSLEIPSLLVTNSSFLMPSP